MNQSITTFIVDVIRDDETFWKRNETNCQRFLLFFSTFEPGIGLVSSRWRLSMIWAVFEPGAAHISKTWIEKCFRFSFRLFENETHNSDTNWFFSTIEINRSMCDESYVSLLFSLLCDAAERQELTAESSKQPLENEEEFESFSRMEFSFFPRFHLVDWCFPETNEENLFLSQRLIFDRFYVFSLFVKKFF